MEVWQMREKIADVYKGQSWLSKVMNMNDDQVIAIYYRFLEQGVFDGKCEIKKLEDSPQIVQQLSIDDFIEGVKYDA